MSIRVIQNKWKNRTDRASPLEAWPGAKSLVSRPERRASTGIVRIERDDFVQSCSQSTRANGRWGKIGIQPNGNVLHPKVPRQEDRPWFGYQRASVQDTRDRPSSRTVPAMNGTPLPAPRASLSSGWSLIIPPFPSRTGRKGNISMVIPAPIPTRRSDELADLRQEKVLFGDNVVPMQDFVLLAKRIQEGIARYGLKTGSVDPNPDWKIYANIPV